MDSAQAKLFRDSLQGLSLCGWKIDGFFGNGKSAVVLPVVKDSVDAAIKVFHPELIERYGKAVQLERILREKSLVGAEHPNLVRILDGGECPVTGHLFVVMERLPYKNLHEVIADVPLQAVPKLIAQVASAARFLEDRGLVHRDIKPENIAITDDFSRAILLDLGVLLPVGLSNITDIDQRPFIGTLRYSSPEFLLRQEDGTQEGWRAVTFYQLGGVLHDMLMKRPLFEDHSEPFSELVEAVINTNPTIYSEDARSVGLAKRCLLKKAATRLELVSWADFSDSTDLDSSSTATARERIKQRQKYFQASTQGSVVPAAEAQRVLRQALDDLCNRFESRVAALLNDLQCFPLRATQSEKDTSNSRCTTLIHFEKDDEVGLPYRLTLIFEITMIDSNHGTPIYKAASAAMLSDAELTQSQLPPTKPFFTGEIQALLDSPSLEQQFLGALEDAYRAQEQGHVLPEHGTLHLI